MKKICIVAVFLLGAWVTYGQNDITEKFKKLSWLEGKWTRTNNKPGRSGAEHWRKPSSLELSGIGFSLKEKDTVFIEKFKIIPKENELFYVADVPENQKPVYFKLTGITATGFVCENPEHDFPKKISYQREGNKLKATISGDGKAVDFLFVRK